MHHLCITYDMVVLLVLCCKILFLQFSRLFEVVISTVVTTFGLLARLALTKENSDSKRANFAYKRDERSSKVDILYTTISRNLRQN